MNNLGFARIFLAIVAFYFMQTNYIVAGWCYIVSALLDAIDGHAARAFNQSKLNKHFQIDIASINPIKGIHRFFYFYIRQMLL